MVDTDIVQRLRLASVKDRIPCFSEDGKIEFTAHAKYVPSTLGKDAATEIESLRTRAEAAEKRSAELEAALVQIRDGYGPNHLSTYARYVATNALSTKEQG